MTKRAAGYVAAFLAAFVFGAGVTSATAGHYETHGGYANGLVHGDSKIDGSYFGRIMFYTLSTDYYCAVGDTRSQTIYFDLWVRNDTCSVWSKREFRSFQDECAGYGGTAAWDFYFGRWLLSNHGHGAHDPPASTCRIYNA